MKRAVLLLLHQGKSFTAEAARAAAKLDLSLVGLSSRPERPKVLAESRRHLADCLVTDASTLGSADVEKAVREFDARGYAVEATVATFEGYRLLMAEQNQALGARDSAVPALRLCLDKYALRQFLFDRGLSEVRGSRLASGDAAPELDASARWFVKPVRGASSFAAFLLKDVRDLEDLPRIREQMRSDRRMAAIFMDQYDFLVEEYVEGPEFSFETLVLDEVWHLCVHEKARVDRRERTTLEAMSISPPTSVDREVLLEGVDHVQRCLTALREYGLTAGAFHIEVKYWEARKRWEIIEINPRMGGSLIDASVQALTGYSLLDLWTESLLLPPGEQDAFRARLTHASQLEALRHGTVSKATVFLSKYGEKGRTVESLRFDPPTRPPRVLKLHAESGTQLDASDRALCLMDALWDVAADDLDAEAAFLDRHATEHFHVRYR